MTYVIDSTAGFSTGEEPEKKFPSWILLFGVPLLLIPLIKKKKLK